MEKYNPQIVEKKWQKYWADQGIYKDYSRPKKFYALDMFPYPSGAGLHVGHPKGYIATDVFSRFKILQGYSVLHPMGWDSFGLPAENYAIKMKIHPRIAVEQNIATFKKQLEMFGFTYDWDKEIATSDPKYYKWTQWIFLKLFEKGLAYESNEPVNWCPSCKTVLSNEDLEKGLCERCGSQVVQRRLRQWVLKMTDYAERLLEDLDKEDLDWEEQIIEQQKNWIGKSEGVEFSMKIAGTSELIDVYTTRVDTVFGMTYAVVAPEHEIIQKLKANIENLGEVEEYLVQAQNKTNLERTELQKEKTGVELKGLKVINPFNDREMPLFVADYVLGFYGTGAVMAVPAHDERDYEFARKNNLPIEQSVAPDVAGFNKTAKTLNVLKEIFDAAEARSLKFWVLGGLSCAFHAGIVYREHDDLDLVAKDDIDLAELTKLLDGMGFEKIGEKQVVKVTKTALHPIYKKDGVEIELGPNDGEFGTDADFEEEVRLLNGCPARNLSRRFAKSLKEHQMQKRFEPKDQLDLAYLNGKVFTDDGIVVASGEYDGLTSEEARKKMAAWLEERGMGKRKVNYKMRDWVFSRQKYWGEPIPIVHCEKCGVVALPEEQLPLTLPEVDSYEQTDTGESPLANISDWVNTICPKCGGPAKRETNTMPQWAGSSWYYLRYIDPENDQILIDKEKEKEWMPVNLYVGGIEHATRHLLYARFWHKFLYDIGAVSTKEPFKRLIHVGLILAEDGRKMSKRWNNVINPDDIIKEFGADSMRLYEMFMGPFTQSVAWSTAGVNGVERFLEKVWRLQDRVTHDSQPTAKKAVSLLHKTIKKVGEDIEGFRFNTAISAMMILVNEFEKQDKLSAADYELLVAILSPFAPHLSEELWSRLGHANSIFKEKWPEYDEGLLKDEVVNLVVQFNGKTRGTIAVTADIDEIGARSVVEQDDKLKSHLAGKEVKKTIFVKGRLINFVVV